MRKLIMFNLVTLDGYFEGPNKEIDWHNVDEGFNEFAIQQLGLADSLLFGRITYELMESYWPTETAIKDDPIIAEKMNRTFKIVFSKTLKKADWNNATIAKNNLSKEVKNLKEQPGKDIVIFGSGTLVTQLTQLGLIDEYRIIVNPVILGKGNSLFKGIDNKIDLKLLEMKVLKSGVVILYYKNKNFKSLNFSKPTNSYNFCFA